MRTREILRQIFKRLTKSDPRFGIAEIHHQSGSKTLNNLPIEIIQYITSFLPTSSAAALALCSKAILKKLGSAYFEELDKGKWQIERWNYEVPSLTDQQAERQTFLLLLDKDVNRIIFCYFCQKLHDPDKTIPDNWIRGERPCSAADRTTLIYGYYGFNYSRIYMAMKYHRLGLDNKVILSQLSRTVTKYYDGTSHQQSLSSRIISNTFYLRTQHWLLLPPNLPPELPKSYYFWNLCWHMRTFHNSRSYLEEFLQCRLSHYEDGRLCPTCSGLKQCKECLTEFQIDVKDLQNRGSAIVITEWQDFGEVLTPFDPKWRCHFTNYPYVRTYFTPGSIKDIFEGPYFDFDAHITKRAEDALLIKSWASGSVFS